MDAKFPGALNALDATAIVHKIAAGETTCEAVTRDCVARIAERDGVVKAWVNFDPELAVAQARALDHATHRGPLHGVPIGVKDIIDTDGAVIPGLYAAGELVGGLFYFNYPGGSGLMAGSVFGRIAGNRAGRAGKN